MKLCHFQKCHHLASITSAFVVTISFIVLNGLNWCVVYHIWSNDVRKYCAYRHSHGIDGLWNELNTKSKSVLDARKWIINFLFSVLILILWNGFWMEFWRWARNTIRYLTWPQYVPFESYITYLCDERMLIFIQCIPQVLVVLGQFNPTILDCMISYGI